MTELTALYAALVAAQKSLAVIAHDAEGNWKKRGVDEKGRPIEKHGTYTTGEAMVEACSAALNAHGLSTFMTRRDVLESPRVTEYRDAVGQNGILSCHFALVHTSGGRIDMGPFQLEFCPGPGRPSDKSELASDTELLGYFFRSLLCVRRGESNEINQRDDSNVVGSSVGGGPKIAPRPKASEPASPATTPTQKPVDAEPDPWAGLRQFLARVRKGDVRYGDSGVVGNWLRVNGLPDDAREALIAAATQAGVMP